jgi:hypothetical protein
VAVRKQRFNIDEFPGSAIFLVGWSNARNRMTCIRWSRWPADSGFAESVIDPASINPETGNAHEVPVADADMEKLAREQVAYTRSLENGAYDCGGRLLVAELTRDTISVRTIADLEATS